jgi:hypothetical protein
MFNVKHNGTLRYQWFRWCLRFGNVLKQMWLICSTVSSLNLLSRPDVDELCPNVPRKCTKQPVRVIFNLKWTRTYHGIEARLEFGMESVATCLQRRVCLWGSSDDDACSIGSVRLICIRRYPSPSWRGCGSRHIITIWARLQAPSITRVPLWWRQYSLPKRRSYFYKTTRCYIPEGCHLHNRRRENLKSHCSVYIYLYVGYCLYSSLVELKNLSYSLYDRLPCNFNHEAVKLSWSHARKV